MKNKKIDNKKIIFFDIDGTIYDHRTGVEPSTKQAIAMLVENGHIPVLCTGRARAMIMEELIALGFQGIVGACGTYVEYHGKPVQNRILSRQEVRRVVDASVKYGLEVILEGSKAMYYNENLKRSKYLDQVRHMTGKYVSLLPMIENMDSIEMNKLTVHFGKESELKEFREDLKDILEAIIHFEADDDNYAECVPVGYSKATGIETLLHHLNIDQKESYAFGDSVNDLEMIQYVNYGIAMGNSSEEVFAVAKYRTSGIYEDGIYNGLKEFALI